MIRAEAALNVYAFLKWLDPFIQGAESISNLDDYSEPGSIEYSQDEYQQFHEEDSQLKDEYDRPDSDSEDSEGEEGELVGDINVNTKVDAQGNKENEENVVSQCTVDGRAQGKVTEEVKNKGSKTQKRSIPPKKPLSKLPDDLPSFKKKKVDPDELLANINKRLHERKEERREKQAKKEQAAKDCIDENDIFGKLVANELRSLPKRKQSNLKHNINEAIFKYQCEIEQEAIDGESQSQQIQQPQLNQQQQKLSSSTNSTTTAAATKHLLKLSKSSCS